MPALSAKSAITSWGGRAPCLTAWRQRWPSAPTRWPHVIAFCTGLWLFRRCSQTSTEKRWRTRASTPLSATRRGTWSAATAANPRYEPGAETMPGGSPISFGKRESTASGAVPTSIATSSFSSVRSSLTRRGGRVGLVLPSGVVSDSGSAGLRRHLFDGAEVDGITGLDNRHGIFPIHRSMRFVLLTATVGPPTAQIACRFGVSRVEELDASTGGAGAGAPLLLTRRLLSRLSGDDDLGCSRAHDRRRPGALSRRSPRPSRRSAPGMAGTSSSGAS